MLIFSTAKNHGTNYDVVIKKLSYVIVRIELVYM